MENGLTYVVGLRSKEIGIIASPQLLFKHNPYVTIGDNVPQKDLEMAEEILKTAKLPELSQGEWNNLEEEIKRFEALNYRINIRKEV